MNIIKITVLFTFFIGSVAVAKPWIPMLKYPSDDMLPVVSYDVTDSRFGADPKGRRECSQAFQKALDEAGKHGGTVFAPAGKYRFGRAIKVPAGVTLLGDFKEPKGKDLSAGGTIFMVSANHDSDISRPFISLSEGGLINVTIFYPKQKASQVVPYPYTVRVGGNAEIRNVFFVNSYRAIRTESFSTVVNVYGSPLDIGIAMLHAAAVPRCNRVRFAPDYWAASGLPGAPRLAELKKTLTDRKACGIHLHRQDAGIFMDVALKGYHTGVKVLPPHGWTYWHDLYIDDCEVGVHFAGGSNQRINITSSSISARKDAILMELEKESWAGREKEFMHYSKSKKKFGISADRGDLRMLDCKLSAGENCVRMDSSFRQSMDLQGCIFKSWGDKKDHFAINVDAGARSSELDVYDCEFKQGKRQVKFQGNSKHLTIKSNTFPGKPDFNIHQISRAEIDHQRSTEFQTKITKLKSVPNTLPARTDKNSLYIVTEPPYSAASDGKTDASRAIQAALNAAGKAGGGTVYLTQGSYLLKNHLTVPAGVELRGVNDCMPRGRQVRTLLVVDIPADRGKVNNKPLISLNSTPKLGGSGVTGLSIWYKHQDYKKIAAYPWTVRGLGPRCWVRRVYMGNCYNGVDFATHNSDQHVLSRVNGSALNIAFMVGKSKTIGWVDNCHVRPQDWAVASGKNMKVEFPGENKPTLKDIHRGTKYSLIPNMKGSGTITVGSGANVQITGYFTNGSTRAFDFVDHDGTGGGNANIMIGGSEAGWGAWVKSVGEKGIHFTNFSINPMTRLEYVKPVDIPKGNLPKGLVMKLDSSLPKEGLIRYVISKFYSAESVDVGFDLAGGTLELLQTNQEHKYQNGTVRVHGGALKTRNVKMGKLAESRK